MSRRRPDPGPLVAFGLAVLLVACDGQAGMRFATSTPRDAYVAALEDLGLTTTALGRDWAAAAAAVLAAPVDVTLPHREVRYLDPRQATAVAYRLSLEQGQRVAARIEVPQAQPSELTFFLELFFLPDSLSPPQLVASADSSAWEFEYVAMRPGDYVFGWDIPHGPYEYPDGCEVFIVYMGDASHVWEKEDLVKHKNIWKPTTRVGKKGVVEHIRKRRAGKV